MLRTHFKANPDRDFISMDEVVCSLCGKQSSAYMIDNQVFRHNKRLGAPHVMALGCESCGKVICRDCLRGQSEGWSFEVDFNDDEVKTGMLHWQHGDATPRLCVHGPNRFGEVYLKPNSVDSVELLNREPRLMEILWFVITPFLAAIAIGFIIVFLGWIGLNSPPLSFSSGRVLEDLAEEMFSGTLALYLVAIAAGLAAFMVLLKRMRTSHPPFCSCFSCNGIVDEASLLSFINTTRQMAESMANAVDSMRCVVCDIQVIATIVSQEEYRDFHRKKWVSRDLARPRGFACEACGSDYCVTCWNKTKKSHCKQCCADMENHRVLVHPAALEENWGRISLDEKRKPISVSESEQNGSTIDRGSV